MDSPTQNSENHFYCKELQNAYSFKRCCFFVFVFLLFIVAALGLISFIVIFVLKPKQPIFSLQAINLDAYKLDAYSSSTFFVSSLVSLTLNAQNPNKVGIRYGPSRLHVLHEGLPIGEIRVPKFNQPAHSMNVSVRTRAFFECVDVSQLIYGVSPTRSVVQLKILGDITARVQLLHVTLPKFKVALECDIGVDYRNFMLRNELGAIRVSETNFATFSSTNCSVALYM